MKKIFKTIRDIFTITHEYEEWIWESEAEREAFRKYFTFMP